MTEKTWGAKISARYVPMLTPLIADFDRQKIHGLLIEPHPEGGALLVATNGVVLAAIHDKDARVSAGARRVLLPPEIVGACRQPKLPALYSDGDEIESDELKVPGWMKPAWLVLYEICCMVCPEDEKAPGVLAHCIAETGNHYRDSDYRVEEGFLDWRKAVPADPSSFEAMPITLSPTMLPLLAPFGGDDRRTMGLRFWTTAPGKAVAVRSHAMPEFFGLIMPMTHQNDVEMPIPGWLPLVAAEPAPAE